MSLMIKSNRLYDTLNSTVRIYLPGFGVLYVTLAGTWDLPASKQVAATCGALAVFLGLFLKKSSDNYKADRVDGEVHVTDEGHVALSSEDVGAAIAKGKDEVVLKVRQIKTPKKPAKKASKTPAKKAARTTSGNDAEVS